MDFQLNEDQQALAAGVRSLCQGRFALEGLRQAEGAGRVMDHQGWRQLGEAGVFSIALPQAQGGVGLGLADATVVFEELGRALVPGPLVGTLLAAGALAGAADGTAQVGVIEQPPPSSPGAAALPVVVEHLEALDALVVLPRPFGGDQPAVWGDLEAIRRSARRVERPLDPLTPLWQVDQELALEHPGAPLPQAAELWHRAQVLTGALQVGMAARCVELATEHARERQQFGRAIGSFQAIKHLCADMLVRAETARCAVQSAAVMADQPEVAEVEAETAQRRADEVRWRAAAGAKLLADEAAITNARACIQVHGGMGFTWEVPVHLYLKRARVLSTTFGTPAQLAETVAALA